MQRKKILLLAVCAVVVLLIGLAAAALGSMKFDFARPVSEDERTARLSLVAEAEKWLGTQEGSPEHAQLLEIYNTHQPLAQGYEVKLEDNWCAAFVSACAITLDITDIIPTECGCQRQIGLWQDMGRWEEDDGYTPLPGDIIYYSSDAPLIGDNTAWSDHVGIVVGTWMGFLKVIEGNVNNQVAYRYIPVDHASIRGYALPDYS